MKLSSHGCSFVYGSDLSSPALSWPALIADHLGYEYQCQAVPGSGNLQIMESVLLDAAESDFCVVNWTWIDRFDFVDSGDESWHTLRPALDNDHAAYYFRYLHGQYRDMLTNLAYITTAVSFLVSREIPFLMTYMDDLLFDEIYPGWHRSDAILYLQQKVRPYLHDFDGLSFLDWSRRNSYAVSNTWHPLEQAHTAAAHHMLPIIDAILRKA